MSLSVHDFNYVRELVQRRSAIALDAGKEYLVESRLASVAAQHGCASLQELVTRLRAPASDRLQHAVVEAMTTNETSFFRDVHPFEALRKAVLPELIQRRAVERRLNIWCAACSSGQEPYSIAMLVREHFPALLGWNLRLYATDLSNEMVERARQGRYRQLEVNRGLPAPMVVKYFERQGTEWQLKEEVRRMVEFRRLNLIEPWPAWPPMDLVFLRNVLIYFDTPTKQGILGKMRRVLRPDGCLFLGGAETTLNLDDAFVRVQYDRAGCYRLRGSESHGASVC